MAKKPQTKKTEDVSDIQSERSKRFLELKNVDDIQKDIQAIYAEAGKEMLGIKDNNLKHLIQRKVIAISRNVNETKTIGRMDMNQISGFWNNAYGNLEIIKTIKQNF